MRPIADTCTRDTPPDEPERSSPRLPPAHIPRRRLADLWFASGILALLAMTLLGLDLTDSALRDARTPAPAVTVAPTPTPEGGLPVIAGADVRRTQVHIYPMPTARPSLMQPAMDRDGNLWFGEMRANKLARLDPRTGEVREWQPPNGAHGLMAAAVAPDGSVWFAEDEASYIARFDPRTERFTTYPLRGPSGRSAMPQQLAFDRAGRLWFTIELRGEIARLDPTTGDLRTWHVLPASGTDISRPYSLAVTPEGQVWFGAAQRGGLVGHLDPTTGHVTLSPLRFPDAQVTSMAYDGAGYIWFTEQEVNRFGRIDTRTGAMTELDVPPPADGSAGIYSVAITPDHAVWLTHIGANALLRYDPAHLRWTAYALPIPTSVPYGLLAAPDGSLWYTADGPPAHYVGHLIP